MYKNKQDGISNICYTTYRSITSIDKLTHF